MVIFYVLPFGGALFARLRHQLLQAWLTWLGLSLVSFLVLLLFSVLTAEESLGIVCLSSVIGFIGPELRQIFQGWGRSFKQFLIKFLSKPRNAVTTLFLMLCFYALYYDPDMLQSLLVIAILFFALRFVLYPMWKSIFGRKRR